MTQLDLPPISFARYLDLVRRRKWQVIPMSALGLLIGGVVAFFIPRLYVAETQLVYTGLVLDADSKTGSDPLYQMVLGAKLSMMAAVPKTAETLEWVGEKEDDPGRQAILEQLRARTTVDAWRVDKERSDYAVRVTYRDQDGVRAKEFANKLRETWTRDLMQRFNEIAAEELRLAAEGVTQTSRALDQQITEINNFRRENDIERGEEEMGQSGTESLLKTDIRFEEGEITRIEADLAALDSEVGFLEQEITEGFVPMKIRKSTPLSEDPQLAERARKLLESEMRAKMARDGWRPGTYWYQHHQAVMEAAQRQLRALAPTSTEGGAKIDLVDNPEYVQRLREIAQKKARMESLRSQVDVHRRAATQLRSRLKTLPTIWNDYESKLAAKAEIEERLRLANERASSLRARYDRARTINPFTQISPALVPPTPTDPNVTVVALVGSLLGLGLAIGLVLLLDVMRSSFKTVDDVGYALKLPVLGVMAHLETEEARIEILRHRRVVTAVIATFLILLLSVLTVYFIAPLRLPTQVLQVLDAILGGSEPVR